MTTADEGREDLPAAARRSRSRRRSRRSCPARIAGDVTLDVKATDAGGNVLAHGRAGLHRPGRPAADARGAAWTATAALRRRTGPTAVRARYGDAGPDGPDSHLRQRPHRHGRDVRHGHRRRARPARARPRAATTASRARRTRTWDRLARRVASYTRDHRAHGAATSAAPRARRTPTTATAPRPAATARSSPARRATRRSPPGSPGACPTSAGCDDGDPCTQDVVRAAGTCGAICTHVPITRAVAREPRRLLPGRRLARRRRRLPERVRRRPPRRRRGLRSRAAELATRTPAPSRATTAIRARVDVRQGSACHATLREHAHHRARLGRRLLPGARERAARTATARPTCGNGVVETGEACDDGPSPTSTTPAVPCPKSCPSSPSACLKNVLAGDAATCTARCELTPVTTCGPTTDGCCAAGCTAANGPRLLADLRRRHRPADERRDVRRRDRRRQDRAPAPRLCAESARVHAATCSSPRGPARPRACSCPSRWRARATAAARRAPTPRSIPDCAPLCGNGVVEAPGETCDYRRGHDACPSTCPGGDTCTPVRLEGDAGHLQRDAASPSPSPRAWLGRRLLPGRVHDRARRRLPRRLRRRRAQPGRGLRSRHHRRPARRVRAHLRRRRRLHERLGRRHRRGLLAHVQPRADHGLPRRRRLLPRGLRRQVGHRLRRPPAATARSARARPATRPRPAPSTCPDDGDPCTREVLAGDATHCTAVCRHEPGDGLLGERRRFLLPDGLRRAATSTAPTAAR